MVETREDGRMAGEGAGYRGWRERAEGVPQGLAAAFHGQMGAPLVGAAFHGQMGVPLAGAAFRGQMGVPLAGAAFRGQEAALLVAPAPGFHDGVQAGMPSLEQGPDSIGGIWNVTST